eukprot:285786-Chlamydomonas_euryale.AAC.1
MCADGARLGGEWAQLTYLPPTHGTSQSTPPCVYRLGRVPQCACATPRAVSSNVVMTALACGDEAVALINAVLGNIIGIFVSPALLQ